MSTPDLEAPLLPSMRRLLQVAAFLVFLAGLQLFVFPLRTEDWFAWTIDVPMTAVFLGAAYWASAVLELAGSRAEEWDTARLSVWTVFVFTTLTLLVSLVHLDKFHLGAEQPLSARLVTWGWLAIYVGVPVAMLVIAWRQARSGRAASRPGRTTQRLATGLRALLVLLAVVLLGTGVALLARARHGRRALAVAADRADRASRGRVAGRPRVGGRPRPAGRRRRGRPAARPHRRGVRGAAGGGARPVRRPARVGEPGRDRLRRGARPHRGGVRLDPRHGRPGQSSGRNGVSIASVNRRCRSRASHSESVSSRQLVWSSWKISSSDRAKDSSMVSTLTS